MSILGINRISPSMIKEYEDCPKLFYYRSWLGLKLPQTQVHFAFGNAIHLAVGNIYDQLDNEDLWKHAEIKIVKDIFLENFKLEHLDKDELNYNDQPVYPTEVDRVKKFEEMRDDGLLIIKSYWDVKEDLLATYDINPTQFEVVAKFQITHPITKETLEIPGSGRVDAINHNGGIVEMKTSKAKYDEVETRNLPQALFYVMWHYLTKGEMPPWLAYVVMRKGLSAKSKDRIQILKYTYEEADVLAFMARIESIIEKIRAHQFDRPTIGHPPFCDCYKFEKALSTEDIKL